MSEPSHSRTDSTWPRRRATLSTWTRAGTAIRVDHAIHEEQLDGIPYFGPAADPRRDLGPGTFVLCSSGAGQPAQHGAVGAAFADAMSGAADLDADRATTGR